jgi:hypothetical protein
LRLGKVIDGLLAETAAHEAADRLVLVAASSRGDRLERHSHLARDAEERRSRKALRGQWKPEERSFGDRMQSIVANHVRRPWRQRVNQSIGDAQLAAQRDGRGLLNEHRVGAAVDHPSILTIGSDDATGTRRSLEEGDGQTAQLKLVRGRKTCNAAADDRDVNAGHRSAGSA